MRPGVTLEQARPTCRAFSSSSASSTRRPTRTGARFCDLKEARVGEYRRASAADFRRGPLLLLIAIANVAGLMLVQLRTRRRVRDPQRDRRVARGRWSWSSMREVAILAASRAHRRRGAGNMADRRGSRPVSPHPADGRGRHRSAGAGVRRGRQRGCRRAVRLAARDLQSVRAGLVPLLSSAGRGVLGGGTAPARARRRADRAERRSSPELPGCCCAATMRSPRFQAGSTPTTRSRFTSAPHGTKIACGSASCRRGWSPNCSSCRVCARRDSRISFPATGRHPSIPGARRRPERHRRERPVDGRLSGLSLQVTAGAAGPPWPAKWCLRCTPEGRVHARRWSTAIRRRRTPAART